MAKERRTFLAAAALLAAAVPSFAATTWIVHVGRGGTNFVDDATGGATTTIQVGDTVQWVWEGDMMHSVTSGNCARGGGGGGYGGYGGGDECTDAHTWTTTGLQGSGFTFSHTFGSAGNFAYYCAMHQSSMTAKVVVQQPKAAGPCTPGDHTLCLNGGRFAVTAHWTKTDGSNGDGTVVGLTDDSGYFWFFDSANIEVTVKVLDACAINGAHWVFAAGLTNVQVDLKVVDTSAGVTYTKQNPQGSAFVPIQDTNAFPSSCP
jgi:plastocyanin